MTTWTKTKIEALKDSEVRQLRENARSRHHSDLVQLCDEVLAARPRRAIGGKAPRRRERDGRKLVSRAKSFEMRGVKLRNPRWSWGGVRPANGEVVFTVWAANVEKDGTQRRYLLYGPNRGGDRPWSDTAGGRERLEHCRLAAARGEAEGVLIYGEQRGRDVSVDEASRVSGADPDTVLRFTVVQEGEEYWALWNAN